MIIPAIYEKDFNTVITEIKAVDGVASLIQIDISDGKFVKNKTFDGIKRLDSIETPANFELHLMVTDPLDYVGEKLNKVTRICAHVEANDVEKFIAKSKDLGYKVGLSINPETPLEDVAPFVESIDYVQFMTVIPGAQGNKFEIKVLDKIAIFKQTAPHIPIQVDGGIDEETLTRVLEAGVENVAVGSQIYQTPKESLEHFEQKANEPKHVHEEKKEIKKIAFLGGAAWQKEDEPYKLAFETAKLLAKKGYQIVNGGGPGVMRASTEGAHKGGGKALAVTYYPNRKHKNYEGTDKLNKFDEEIKTLDYFDRTKVMLQNSDVHVIFKGGTGTISEFGMTWASSRIHEGHHKPILLVGDYWNHIIEEFKIHMLMRPGEVELVKVVETPEEVLDCIRNL